MKILNISNSHGMDSVWLLPLVLKTEMPEKEIFVAELYQSYALTQHIQAAKNDENAYFYFTNNGSLWRKATGVSARTALKAQHWDIIMFNESSRHLGLEEKMSQGMIDWFRSYILDNIDYEPMLLYNMTWANPTDRRLYDDESRQHPPLNFDNTYLKNYGFDHIQHYNKLVEMTNKYIVARDDFDKIIYGAKPVQYAGQVLGVPQYDPEQKLDLYRDYTHISDFARLIVAYQWYCQVFGVNKLEQVNVNVIPADLRATYRQQKLGNQEITEKHKRILIESVNETLRDPFTIPKYNL